MKLKNFPLFREEDLSFIFGNNEKTKIRYLILKKIVFENYTYLKASKEFSVNVSSIKRWISKFKINKDLNSFFDDKKGPKSNTKINDKIIKKVIRIKNKNKKTTGKFIHSIISENQNISLKSIYRILKKFKEGKYNYI